MISEIVVMYRDKDTQSLRTNYKELVVRPVVENRETVQG